MVMHTDIKFMYGILSYEIAKHSRNTNDNFRQFKVFNQLTRMPYVRNNDE